MNEEAQRLGIFDRRSQEVQQVKPSLSSPVEEIEKEEKKALEDILRERSKS